MLQSFRKQKKRVPIPMGDQVLFSSKVCPVVLRFPLSIAHQILSMQSDDISAGMTADAGNRLSAKSSRAASHAIPLYRVFGFTASWGAQLFVTVHSPSVKNCVKSGVVRNVSSRQFHCIKKIKTGYAGGLFPQQPGVIV